MNITNSKRIWDSRGAGGSLKQGEGSEGPEPRSAGSGAVPAKSTWPSQQGSTRTQITWQRHYIICVTLSFPIQSLCMAPIKP